MDIRDKAEAIAVTADVAQSSRSTGPASTARSKRRWLWSVVGVVALIIAAHYLLQSITIIPAKVAYALGFKERYEQQVLENKERRDLDIDKHMRESGPRITESYQFDEPSDRTFVAKIEDGLTDISPIGDILRPDGTILSLNQMVRERVRPTALKATTQEDVRLLTFHKGPVNLWSNGGLTAYDKKAGHNLPTGVTVFGNHKKYSDDLWPFYQKNNEKGEPYDANPRNPSYLVERQITRDVTAIAQGYNFLLALRADGKVWGSGGNEFGQLGTDSDSYRGFTRPVDGLRDVVSIAAGTAHGLALKKDGTVWEWGQANLPLYFGGYDYQYRNPTSLPKESAAKRAPEGFNPKVMQVQGLPPIKKVAAARNASFVLARDGTVWVWGGLTGCIVGTTSRHPEWAKVKLGATRGLTEMVVEPFQVPGVNGVVDIAVAANHVLALMKDGTVWGWGYSGDPTIGRAETTEISQRGRGCEFPRRLRGFDNVKQIFTKPKVSAIVKNDDTLWMMGDCPMCSFSGVAEDYNYIMKPRPGEGGKRVLVFEIHRGPSLDGRGSRDPKQHAEFGFYWVDDSAGRVNGMAPWEPGYLRAALSPHRVTRVYSLPATVGVVKKIIVDTTDPKRMLAFYLIAKGSLEQWRERNPDNKLGRALTNVHRDGTVTAPFPDETDFGPEPMAFSSIPFANPGGGVVGFSVTRHAPIRNGQPTPGDHGLSWSLIAVAGNRLSSTSDRLDGHLYIVHGLEFLSYPELPNHAMSGTNDYERFQSRHPEDIRRKAAQSKAGSQ
jgi:hypothetical protein